ncbi:transcriptional regulator [Sulfobacillus acidophilus TPY]|uniref:Ferric uptake regulator, Fur family n=1 Tax=Sulfobacillus acidophilus (strain ATCC 700253 / DSM 10332 / NAL) TaxID=679936 RepID=G8TTR8_SULAD|nr:transcriptional regulator [Sulfobacillus acidophilus TPY]AEW06827.1 ferric uptake regulator, Fur family [Sulfobacillus acidophilus DSM 10332]
MNQKSLVPEFTRFLQEHNMRVTPNRLTVFRELENAPGPMTVPELASRVAEQGLNVATIYRIIETLMSLNVVHPVLIDHQSVGYELIEPFRQHHDHLVCRNCGKIVAIFDERLESVLKTISDDQSFAIDFHQLEVHGICPDCRSKTPNSP